MVLACCGTCASDKPLFKNSLAYVHIVVGPKEQSDLRTMEYFDAQFTQIDKLMAIFELNV